jgi:SAM-dependent methyltransferase
MRRRRAGSHARAALAAIRPGADVVDLGCGPGTITLGLAAAAAPGRTLGIDAEPARVSEARAGAAAEGAAGVGFLAADGAALPLPDASADVAFAHALLEHVPDPVAVLREMVRVVRPGGHVIACSPDWRGFLLSPPEPSAERALDAYAAIQEARGGDVRAGARLGPWLAAAGVTDIRVDARYEVYESARLIAGYLAERLDASGRLDADVAGAVPDPVRAREAAHDLRGWADDPLATFAQAWVTATGRVGPEPLSRGLRPPRSRSSRPPAG